MVYIFYGSLGLLLFKCGTQLLSEIEYKPLNAETELKKKSKIDTEKYQKIIYWISKSIKNFHRNDEDDFLIFTHRPQIEI